MSTIQKANLVISLASAVVVAQAISLLAAPCYQRSAGSVGCYSQGGTRCSSIEQIGLECPGGPYHASTPGVNFNDPCQTRNQEYAVPKHNAVVQNKPDGYAEVGSFVYACSKTRVCTKTAFYAPQFGYACVANTPVPCTQQTVYTADGPPCTVGGE